MQLFALIGGVTTVVLKPTTDSLTVTRDWVEIDFNAPPHHPLDVAEQMKCDTTRVELEGAFTLTDLACALIASGITVKPKVLAAIRAETGKFEKWTGQLTDATTSDQLRMLLQQLTDGQVTLGPPPHVRAPQPGRDVIEA